MASDKDRKLILRDVIIPLFIKPLIIWIACTSTRICEKRALTAAYYWAITVSAVFYATFCVYNCRNLAEVGKHTFDVPNSTTGLETISICLLSASYGQYYFGPFTARDHF